MPLVSIRVPAYNHENYIEDLLNSILLDTYPNKELVIIDDGSTDRTASIIEHWIENKKFTFVVKYKSRDNKGLTATINELLEMSEGEYIVGIASDDVLIDGGIAKRVNYLMNHPEKDAVFCDCTVINEKGEILFRSGLSELYSARKENLLTNKGMKKELILNWSVPGPVLMVRKSIYNDIGLYDENLIVEDWDLYLRMSAQNKLGFLNIIVAKYRIHGKNVSSVDLHKVLNDRIKTAWKNLSIFKYPYNVFLLYEILYLQVLSVYRIIKNLFKR